jgi:hypothetical protein
MAAVTPPRLAVREELLAAWRAACATHEVAWRCWVAGIGDARPVLLALDREEAAAQALARFSLIER